MEFDYYLITESDLDEGDLNRLELHKGILDNIRGIIENIRGIFDNIIDILDVIIPNESIFKTT